METQSKGSTDVEQLGDQLLAAWNEAHFRLRLATRALTKIADKCEDDPAWATDYCRAVLHLIDPAPVPEPEPIIAVEPERAA